MARKKSRPKRSPKILEQKREQKRLDKYFLLHLKKSLYVIMIWVLSFIAHDMILRSGTDETFFFSIAVVVIPIYLFISVIYTLVRHKAWDNEFKLRE